MQSSNTNNDDAPSKDWISSLNAIQHNSEVSSMQQKIQSMSLLSSYTDSNPDSTEENDPLYLFLTRSYQQHEQRTRSSLRPNTLPVIKNSPDATCTTPLMLFQHFDKQCPNVDFIKAFKQHKENKRKQPISQSSSVVQDPSPPPQKKATFSLKPPQEEEEESNNPFKTASGSTTAKKFLVPKTGNSSSKQPQKKIKHSDTKDDDDEPLDPRLEGCDKALVSRIRNEIVVKGAQVTFDDIAGLSFAKKCVEETVLYPMARPDIFKGLRRLPKGILLFGPPGTGKTLIGKALAHGSNATFFSISASSLTSKWIGEGEALVKTLFAVAAVDQPSVVFIDEIDSLLTKRTADENEASRRMKTEFLVRLDGAATDADDVVLIVGATNRPEELDDAARRRLVKRLYIPLPDKVARRDLIQRLLDNGNIPHAMSFEDIGVVVEKTDGYSGADIKALCTEAAMGPVRSCDLKDIMKMKESDVRPVLRCDFLNGLKNVKASVAQKDLQAYLDWNKEFGSYQIEPISEEDKPAEEESKQKNIQPIKNNEEDSTLFMEDNDW